MLGGSALTTDHACAAPEDGARPGEKPGKRPDRSPKEAGSKRPEGETEGEEMEKGSSSDSMNSSTEPPSRSC